MTTFTRIKLLCDNQKISLNTLEEHTGLGKNTIRKWDTVNPSVDKLQAVADYFKVSLDFLVGRDIEGLESQYAQLVIDETIREKHLKEYKSLIDKLEKNFEVHYNYNTEGKISSFVFVMGKRVSESEEIYPLLKGGSGQILSGIKTLQLEISKLTEKAALLSQFNYNLDVYKCLIFLISEKYKISPDEISSFFDEMV
ncbi:helix-turn-helix domain-containing protein [Listeria booriae]|uniref:helix-turn-helix domain-containing protein n=1 Tax=Listeria booriae TaxID=1552123 RepID=UPI0016237B4A|nr:helix-turn-helix transcriptional regulator [Listeria booriae]MBC2103991.1 helix-turn-helix transcriptional regulator [Listeria booriae]